MKKTVKGVVNSDHYAYRIDWSEEDGEYVGRCTEFESLSYLAGSQTIALRGIRQLVKAVLEDMLENGEDIPEPIASKKFNGKVLLRLTPQRHRELFIEAKEQGVSFNRYLNSKL